MNDFKISTLKEINDNFIAKARQQPLDEFERTIGKSLIDMNFAEMNLYNAMKYNASNGKMHLIDNILCNKCKNRGYFEMIDENGYKQFYYCDCYKARQAKRKLLKKGLRMQLENCTLSNFLTKENWQLQLKQKAQEFLLNSAQAKKWLYIGGQVGCGKTHLCLAIINKLLENSHECSYIRWNEFATEVNAVVNDFKEYERLMNEAKQVEILYIDDFLKPINGNNPTLAELKRAYDLIDYRYSNCLITIISGERTLSEIIALDEAIGTRIEERAKGFIININSDRSKNMRSHNDTD